jgi:hypothetical protein
MNALAAILNHVKNRGKEWAEAGGHEIKSYTNYGGAT